MKGAEKAIKETTQMHDWDAMEPLMYGFMTSEQKRKSLILLIF